MIVAMRCLLIVLFIAVCAGGPALAQGNPCPRAAPGSEIAPPPDLYSHKGVLKTDFGYYTGMDDAGRTLFCFQTPDGRESPTLHVNPGDRIRIQLTNMVPQPAGAPEEIISSDKTVCGDAKMTLSSVNIHFHGTNTAPTCHSDEVIHTLVNSGETFSYDVKIPKNEPPGLYWYHPHVHGISAATVEGGATGIIEVEGIANVQPAVAGLPERYLVVRDQAETGAFKSKPVPSWDLSLNYVPISYPKYKPAIIKMNPGTQEFWRVANTAANTVLDLKLTYDKVRQPLQIVAFDGVPLGSQDGKHQGTIETVRDILIPPAGRAEFIVAAPSAQVKQALLSTMAIDTGPSGDSDPGRPLAIIQTTTADLHLPRVAERSGPPNPQRFPGLFNAKVTARRTLYFSEIPYDLPESGRADQVLFFITVDGQKPKLFRPAEPPAITTTQGAVEDWTIQNRSPEIHEFHIHQIHFLLLAINGVPVPEGQRQFYDTYQVPYWTEKGPYPSITVRMDFRGPVVGDFVYHCHILDHEDAGMMAVIRVLPKPKKFHS
ncbi:MAG TPA: multicopper oxidase domain-containing protein [Rhizomicrobium sp.]|jgi:FtsP/CotA-like multicopper oxidase with cupredoxin domain